jgi:3-oxoacyl-[acyl-carrier-protein] synthase II
MEKEELVITGMGALTAFGCGLEAQMTALRDGSSALRPSRALPGCFAAEIEAPPKTFIKRKGLAALSRAAQITAAALENLLEESGASIPAAELSEHALVVGTAYGHLESKARFHEEALSDGPQLVSPVVFPNSIINALAGHAAILFGMRGPNLTVTSGRRSGLEALLRAASLLLAGRARRAVVAACDEVAPALLRALAASNELRRAPPQAGADADSGPPAGDSSGVYPGEASAAVFLESATGAAAAGRVALVRLRGWAEATAVGRSLTAAVGGALRGALERGGSRPEEVSWTALSSCGLEAIDRAEEDAVREVLGGDRPAAALKATFGETFGAAGLLACLAAVICCAEGWVPATPGWTASSSGGPGGLSPGVRPAPPGPVLVSAVDHTGAAAVLLEAVRDKQGDS